MFKSIIEKLCFLHGKSRTISKSCRRSRARLSAVDSDPPWRVWATLTTTVTATSPWARLTRTRAVARCTYSTGTGTASPTGTARDWSARDSRRRCEDSVYPSRNLGTSTGTIIPTSPWALIYPARWSCWDPRRSWRWTWRWRIRKSGCCETQRPSSSTSGCPTRAHTYLNTYVILSFIRVICHTLFIFYIYHLFISIIINFYYLLIIISLFIFIIVCLLLFMYKFYICDLIIFNILSVTFQLRIMSFQDLSRFWRLINCTAGLRIARKEVTMVRRLTSCVTPYLKLRSRVIHSRFISRCVTSIRVIVFSLSNSLSRYIFQENIGNIIDPLEISVSMQLEDDLDARSGSSSSCVSCVVINKHRSKIEDLVKLPFAVDCGDDNVCASDLRVALSIDSTRGNRYTIGSTPTIELRVDARNRGEPAYQTKVRVLTKVLPLASIPPECTENPGDVLEVICDIGNPLRTNVWWWFVGSLDG